jgi:hypothetical protein
MNLLFSIASTPSSMGLHPEIRGRRRKSQIFSLLKGKRKFKIQIRSISFNPYYLHASGTVSAVIYKKLFLVKDLFSDNHFQ